MKSKSLIATASTAALLAGGIIAAAATPAQAAGHHVYAASAGGHARATFKSNGNWFYVFDTMADGHSALGQIYRNKKYTTVWASGSGNSTGHEFNNIHNGSRFKFRACYGNYGTHGWKLTHCGKWVTAVA